MLHPTASNWELNELSLDSEIPVYPLGLFSSSPLFTSFNNICNQSQNAQFRASITPILPAENTPLCVDFRDPEQIYALLTQYEDLNDTAAASQANHSSTLIPNLLSTLEYYIENTQLSDAHAEILRMKRAGVKNTDIVKHINITYGKTYTANYISTIYRKKILPSIANAAVYHEKLYHALNNPLNFKRCSGCGQYYLRSNDNFVRKSRSHDGFANRCKLCDKEARASAK